MMAVHEFGHVLHAWASGGVVAQVSLPLLSFSKTDLSQNPHPLFVAWGGAIWGCIIPLILLVGARFLWPAESYVFQSKQNPEGGDTGCGGHRFFSRSQSLPPFLALALWQGPRTWPQESSSWSFSFSSCCRFYSDFGAAARFPERFEVGGEPPSSRATSFG